MQIVSRPFTPHDLVGGDLALDLVNTATDWDVAPRDWLDSYGRLLEWARLTGRIDAAELAQLTARAETDPMAAEVALVRAREMRETLYRVLRAAADGEAAPQWTLAAAEAAWREAADAMRLTVGPDGASLSVSLEKAGLDLIALRAAAAAMDLLKGDLARLRRCGGSRCGWLFMDTSKAGRRRWCDMSTCGNYEKARRHAGRRKSAEA